MYKDMKIVMLGIIGAGKGTQAVMLSEYLNIPHISTGDIFREAAEKGTELGIKARKIMKAGGLVSDDIVIGIVQNRISQKDVEKGFILDGFPRTISQAEELDKIEDLDQVIYITIPEEEVIKRLTSRCSCEECGKPYNSCLDNIKEGDDCRECGGRVFKREDDSEDTIRIRINNYIEQTKPLIDYYRDSNILKEVDGTKNISEVFEVIKQVIAE